MKSRATTAWSGRRFAIFVGIVVAANVAGAQTNPPPPQPRIVTPGTNGTPPSDAIILFDGSNLNAWRGAKTPEAAWKVENGYMEVTRTGSIVTKEEFGDLQLHLEWATPAEVKGKGQGRGNSGIYLMGRYEIQVLDSFENATYPNGQAGALYGHAAPLVNASRKPGEWQSYDIIFHTPKPRSDGGIEPGSLTVFHNGVLVQDHTPVDAKPVKAAPLTDALVKGPLLLQDHRNPVRYRNIWLRKL